MVHIFLNIKITCEDMHMKQESRMSIYLRWLWSKAGIFSSVRHRRTHLCYLQEWAGSDKLQHIQYANTILLKKTTSVKKKGTFLWLSSRFDDPIKKSWWFSHFHEEKKKKKEKRKRGFLDMVFSKDNMTGIILALLSSVFIGASFIIKKKGLRRAAVVSGVRAGMSGL